MKEQHKYKKNNSNSEFEEGPWGNESTYNYYNNDHTV